jgi:hypothetical protein
MRTAYNLCLLLLLLLMVMITQATKEFYQNTPSDVLD